MAAPVFRSGLARQSAGDYKARRRQAFLIAFSCLNRRRFQKSAALWGDLIIAGDQAAAFENANLTHTQRRDGRSVATDHIDCCERMAQTLFKFGVVGNHSQPLKVMARAA